MINKLLKNSTIFKTIKQDINENRLSHAYLFIGEDMDILVQVSRLVACLLNCEDENSPCLKCSTCNRINKGIFTDVVEMGLENNIVVADVEKITEEVHLSGFESDKLIYLLFNCDNMNDSASNKLLKTLEEPPKNVFFFLCAKNEFSLLQTIKSRTKKVYLNSFKHNEIKDVLLNIGVEKNLAEVCAGTSQGSLTKALNFAKNKESLKVYNFVCKIFEMFDNVADTVIYAGEAVNLKDYFDEWLNVSMEYARDLLMFKIGIYDLICNKQLEKSFENIESKYSKKALLKIMKEIIDLKAKNTYNVNVLELIDEFLLYFAEVRYKCKE